ncbi:MAG TPA: FAD-dependent monooxygenase [Actinomycetales bacterium]|nr:FAD-dependent monooxygenase [Actinomycetales bacterium]
MVDVLVVGAGPTGLALALQAKTFGAEVRVVERRPALFRPSRAMLMHPRTLEVLTPLGVVDELLDRGERSPSATVQLGRTALRVDLADFDLPDTPFPHLLMIRQAVVEEVLAEALRRTGVEVERGVELLGTWARSSGQAAQLGSATEGGRMTADAAYVVGCDGTASIVRELAGIGFHGGAYAEEIVLADLELDGALTPDRLNVAVARSGVLFCFAGGENATWRLLATRAAREQRGGFGQPREPVPDDEIQNLLDGAGLLARVRSVAWSARVPLQHRVAVRYRQGRLLVAGDAAHSHSPAAAQGMNAGIQDATNLGWKLAFASRAADDVADLLLDSYEQERRRVAQRVLALTHLVFWGEAGSGLLPATLRGMVAPIAAPVVPAVLGQRRLVAEVVRVVSGLRWSYRHSALNHDASPGSRGPRPGDRMPDGWVLRGGERVRLHSLLARPGLHVLLQSDATAPAPADGACGPWLQMHRLDVPGSGMLVVRPDGFVGYRSAGSRTRTSPNAELVQWLRLFPGSAPLDTRDIRL